MKLTVDYLIVGSGLTGAVLGRLLADAGREVLILERRSCPGGNVHDYVHPSGIRIHTYGPHYFRTSSEKIWEFVNRFARFYPYEARVKSLVKGSLQNWPVTLPAIRRMAGEQWQPAFAGNPANFEEALLSQMPGEIYKLYVKEYNEKQWGVSPDKLSADLCKRISIREDDDPRLTPNAIYQGLPEAGYANMMARMVENIPLLLHCDYLDHREDFQVNRMIIYTGSIDQYYGFDLGRLAYRGQKRVHTYLLDADYAQPCGQINTPSHESGPAIRTIEWKHFMQKEFGERIHGTVVTSEVPWSPDNTNDSEYPFPDEANRKLYEAYRKRADSTPGLLVCGRLGDYRYYDMDDAIGCAMTIARKILG